MFEESIKELERLNRGTTKNIDVKIKIMEKEVEKQGI